MKTRRFLLLILCLTIALPSDMFAQSSEVPAEILSALQAGDVSKLSGFLNNSVELVIANNNDVFSKQQASAIISDFFKSNKISTFQVMHKQNKDAASFAICTLKTNNGSFRLYVLTRINNGQNLIQQLRIEPSND
ncbi:MAG: DUF4783 domain-containing protein [Prevotellaceae bacterium]|jgi:hypothetical protein|nr:DUF4783 domain-containing protein [Prevotellaceae bacterium]